MAAAASGPRSVSVNAVTSGAAASATRSSGKPRRISSVALWIVAARATMAGSPSTTLTRILRGVAAVCRRTGLADDQPLLRRPLAGVQQQPDRDVLPFLLLGRDVELRLARRLQRALDRRQLRDDARPERIDHLAFEEVHRLAHDLLQPRRR